jgi:hypothetical protein
MDLTGRSIGNYVIRSRLGAGGMGTVYLCEHPLLKRKVALKVLHEEHSRQAETVERFFNEAKAANDIRHPNIVDVYDFGTVPAAPGEPPLVYLIMELLDGQSLAAALPSLTQEQAVHVARQCCRALAASHDKGIVHRDIKPENIFLVRHEEDPLFVKIVDFGIAKLLRPGEGGKTRMGMVIGTPLYMSPEQCEGLGRVDHRADIYALGVVLYQMVTKRLPFVGENFSQIVIGHTSLPPPPPSLVSPGVPADLEAIILHALEKDPARRFQSMAELAAALDHPAEHLAAWRAAREVSSPGRTLILPDAGLAGEVVAPPVAAPAPAARVAAATWIAGGAAVLVGVAAIVVGVAVALRDRAPARTHAPPVAVAVATADAAPALVRIVVRSDPAGARVTRGGLFAGVTPLVLEVERGAPAIELELDRDGFVTARQTLATDASREVIFPLAAVPPPSPPPRPTNPDLKPPDF